MIGIKYYAGIGSRETPKNVLEFFKRLGTWLARQNVVLRSGGAGGADLAFEKGCSIVGGKKEIYIPWKGFNGSTSSLYGYNHDAQEIAAKFHPAWHNLKPSVRQMHTRNVCQVLGQDLKTPSSFVLCWTKNGSGQGGTGQALRIAKAYEVPIFDAGKYKDMIEMKSECKKFIGNFIGG